MIAGMIYALACVFYMLWICELYRKDTVRLHREVNDLEREISELQLELLTKENK